MAQCVGFIRPLYFLLQSNGSVLSQLMGLGTGFLRFAQFYL